MKKVCKIILCVACLTILCLCMASCSDPSKLDQYREEGMIISVRYDANGGEYLGNAAINAVMDLFNPQDYTADANGNVHITLTEPTDPGRPAGGSDHINLTRPGYFYTGWYRERNVVTNQDGQPMDENGNILYQNDEGYFLDAECTKTAIPAYTYAKPWNFDTDTVEYAQNDPEGLEITLYAGWIKQFEFNYYVQENGAWKKLSATTPFDYKTVNAEGSKTSDKDTIWIPYWPAELGAMNYIHEYEDKSLYTFPKIEGTTFDKAYSDEACTQQITKFFEHKGSVDQATATAIDPVQNIYILTTPGEQYKITTAQQLIDHVNPNGLYEIMADLDFKDLNWPSAFVNGTFKGTMKSTEGQNYKLSNITAKYSSTNAQNAGLFGKITASAVIENLTFENVTLDIVKANARMSGVSIGLFSGLIEENAHVNVVIENATLRLGAVNLPKDGYDINLVAGGRKTGITVNQNTKLVVYGDDSYFAFNDGKYVFSIDPAKVTVDPQTYDIGLTFVSNLEIDPKDGGQLEYEISY